MDNQQPSTLINDDHRLLAKALDTTPEKVAAFTNEEMRDAAVHLSFKAFGLAVAHGHDRREDIHLMDEGPDEQAERITTTLTKLRERLPLMPFPENPTVNLFGFGEAPIHFAVYGDDGNAPYATERYLLLSEVAEQLSIPLHHAAEWARREEDETLRTQRNRDEERGALGWECLNDVIDLGLWMTQDDPAAKPDAGGKRWSVAGDWLISSDRLMSLMTISPWSKEFMSNAMPLFGHALRATMGDLLKDIPTYTVNGEPTGGNAYTDLAHGNGLTVDEAAERAMRGPILDTDEDHA